MGLLTLAFKILMFCGMWKPRTWTTASKTIIYGFYTFLVTIFVLSFICSQMIDLITIDNMNDFTERSHMLLTLVIAFCKAMNILISRDKIVKLVDILSDDICISIDSEELTIQRRYDQNIQSNTLRYAIMIETSVFSSMVNSLLTDLQARTLPFGSWIPYDYSSTIVFYLTYFYQIISWVACSLFHVSVDALFCGFLLQICCQIDILKCRLKHLSGDGLDDLRQCIRHHYQIYVFAEKVNKMFEMMIFIQFFVTTSTVCVSLYQLTKVSPISFDFAKISFYMYCILIQVYLYCWYGSLVASKSEEIVKALFETDWTTLNDGMKKNLLFMMKRTMKPIVLVVIKILPVNLDSFVSILKTSYSAYNILQQTNEQ